MTIKNISDLVDLTPPVVVIDPESKIVITPKTNYAFDDTGRSCLVRVNTEHLAVRQLAKTIKAGDMFLKERTRSILLVMGSKTQSKYGLLHSWTWLYNFGNVKLRVCDKAELTLLREDETYEYLGNLINHKPEWL